MRWEEFEQQAVCDWAYKCYKDLIWEFLCKNNNEGKHTYGGWNRLKKQGFKTGMSDMFLAIPKGPYGGFWIEMKRPKTPTHAAGKLTKEQESFLIKMRAIGYKAECYYSGDDAIKAIAEYCGVKCKL